MFSLHNKKAYITGGLSGIGKSVAERFIENKARVIIADIEVKTEVLQAIGANFTQCDVSNENSVVESFVQAEKLLGGRLDVVVLNAGIGTVGPTIEETESEQLELMTAINQWGVFYGLKHAPKYMNNGGSIIVTSSMASTYSVPGTGVYSSTKASINSMVAMSALELGSRGIRVNSLCPGYVNTALGNSKEEQLFSQVTTALGRHGDAKTDIAPVYLFFASSASQYITGQAIAIDAGMNLGAPFKLIEKITGNSTVLGSSDDK